MVAVKRYKGKDFLLKMIDRERPELSKRYNMKWYVKDEQDCRKNLYQGEINFRCVDKDKNKRVMQTLEKLKKQYKLPTTEIIYISIRRL